MREKRGDGEHTPWFPSARVFRKADDWAGVVERLRRALCATSAPCNAGRREDA